MYSEPFSIRSIGDYAPQSTPNVRQRRSLVCLYRYGAGTLARRHPGKAFRQGIQAGRQAGRSGGRLGRYVTRYKVCGLFGGWRILQVVIAATSDASDIRSQPR